MTTLASLSEILAGLAVVGFVGVTLWLLTRPRDRMAVLMPTYHWLLISAAAVGGWCAIIFLSAPGASEALVARSLRNLAMLGWLGATFWSAETQMARPLRTIFRLLVTFCLVAFLFGVVAHLRAGVSGGALSGSWMAPGLAIVAMITASGGLLLVDSGLRNNSAGLRMPVLAVAGGFAMLWGYELNVELIGAMTGKPAETLQLLLPAAALVILPTFVFVAMDVGREQMRLSRAVAMRTLVLLGVAAYLVLIGLTGAVARMVGGDYGELAQGMFLIVALGAGGLLLASARSRAWLSVMISKHFFEHRYDYRAEWMRFTATLGQSGEGESDLYRRVAQGLAELTASPAALLMLPDQQGNFGVADHWHWPAGVETEDRLPLRTGFMLEEQGHIVDLDRLRNGDDAARAALAIPDWLIADRRAWVIVPVLHFGRMIAAVVLHRPAASRSLDWEDLDVLRIAGRQAASYLAESQSQQALSEAKRFDEFNRRFAFIMHDIKNLASQLSLLAKNAGRHADNPEFRADMVETLKLSAGRMGDMLTRLAPRGKGRVAEGRDTILEPLLTEIADEARQRHPLFLGCAPEVVAWGDAASIRQIVQHLVTNAIDASDDRTAVQLLAAVDGGRVRIDVLDQGRGMRADFIRDELFKPFVSTKEGGFGLGAFEAMQLAQAMGGSIEVSSDVGKGSCFTLWLPAADAIIKEDDEFLKVATR